MDRLFETFNQLPKINFRNIFYPIEEGDDEDEYIYEQLSKGKDDYFENDDTIPTPSPPSSPSASAPPSLENEDKYAFVLIGCHGAIPIKCTINPDGTKSLDVVVTSNREMVLTQFIESAAGCLGFLTNDTRQGMFQYLGEQLETFYDILKNNPIQVTPEKTYKFFIKTAYNLQILYRGNLFNAQTVKTKSMKFDVSVIKAHNEALDYGNMQYISKNFIEKIYLVRDNELINNHGIYLYTKDYPRGINIFNDPELVRRIQSFEKELTDIDYDSISSLRERESKSVTLFSIMKYLESIGITKTFLHDTSCSELLSVRQSGQPGSCKLTAEETVKVTKKIRRKIISNQEQRRRYREYFREKKKMYSDLESETDTTEPESNYLKKYPSVGSLGRTFTLERQMQQLPPERIEQPSNFLTSNITGTIKTNPLQRYPTEELREKYNKRNIQEVQEDADAENEPTIRTKRTRVNTNKRLMNTWKTPKRKRPMSRKSNADKTGGRKYISMKKRKHLKRKTLRRKNKK